MSSVSLSNAPRALITGIDGFTGPYLAESLASRGFDVFGTTHSPGPAFLSNLYNVDLCDRTELGRVISEVQPDIVAHLAAISFVAHGNVEDIYRVNIVGTRNLLEALSASTSKPRQVLVASSANIYGNARIEIIDEEVTPTPANDYGISKLAMEHVANLWSDRLPIAIVRPFNYTGIGQGSNFLIPKIVSHFQSNASFIELGNIDIERDFSDVRRVADAYSKLLSMQGVKGIFNVCSGEAYSLREIVGLMQKIAGYQIDIRVNPAFVRANEIKRLRGSCEKLIDTIGDIKDIPIGDTLDWMFRGEKF